MNIVACILLKSYYEDNRVNDYQEKTILCDPFIVIDMAFSVAVPRAPQTKRSKNNKIKRVWTFQIPNFSNFLKYINDRLLCIICFLSQICLALWVAYTLCYVFYGRIPLLSDESDEKQFQERGFWGRVLWLSWPLPIILLGKYRLNDNVLRKDIYSFTEWSFILMLQKHISPLIRYNYTNIHQINKNLFLIQLVS